jgi:hypothetical protein
MKATKDGSGVSAVFGFIVIVPVLIASFSELMIRNKDTVPEHIDFTMSGDEVILMPRRVDLEEPIAN